jgi:cellulose synthase/poly-beta-1,6-N-acetylglucosamine synthase-like glycosyltransferase
MGGKTIQFYDCAFFAGHSDRGLQSARPILPDLCSRLQRVRVFDIGCGGLAAQSARFRTERNSDHRRRRRRSFHGDNPARGTGETVTVAVSLYNYEEFIGACLESILSQTWADLDLVVVDDASPNENALVVARDWMVAHAQRFRRALLLRHRRNQGLAMTRNTAFRHALGDFAFVIDCDNVLYPRATTRLRQVADHLHFCV